MIAAVLAVVLLQGSPPSVRELVDAVTERDPSAAFKAISRLVDLADTRQEEVEREAARMPAFYREVLQSELKARRELGSRFGKGIRIDLKGAGRSVSECMEEVGRQPGMGVLIGDWNRKYLTAPFDREIKDAWTIEALVQLCERVNWRVNYTGDDGLMHLTGRGDHFPKDPARHWFFYRNIAVAYYGSAGFRKIIDFSGKPQWTAYFGFEAALGPETKLVMWSNLRLIEAVAGDGRALQPPPIEDTALPGFDSLSSSDPSPFYIPSIALRIPDDTVNSLSRLRFSVVAKVATEYRHYVISDFSSPEKMQAGDEYFDVSIREGSEMDYQSGRLAIQVRPKKFRHADLAGIPGGLRFQFKGTGPSGPGAGGFIFTGKGEVTTTHSPLCTLKPVPVSKDGFNRHPVRFEVIIPIGLQDRPIFAEFRDIPLR